MRVKLKQVGETESHWRLEGVIGIRRRGEVGFFRAWVAQKCTAFQSVCTDFGVTFN